MITGHDFWGYPGLPVSLPLTLKAMSDRGWHVDFVTNEKPSVYDEATKLYGEPPSHIGDVKIYRVPIPFNPKLWEMMGRTKISRSIRQRLRMEWMFFKHISAYAEMLAHQADVIYGYEIYGVIVASKLARKYRKKLVTRYQGTFANEWLEGLGNPLTGWLTYCKYWVHWKALKQKADLAIMTDDGTQGIEVLKTLGNESPIRFWRNGLDIMPSEMSRTVLRNKLDLPLDKRITVSVSRLASWKRIDRIISALPYVIEALPELIHVIIGDGECRNDLEAQAKKLNVEEHILFLGTQPHYLAAQYIEASDIFLSLFSATNIGNPTLEALRLGVPIIALDVGDTHRLIKNRINGLLLPDANPIRVAESMVEILTDSQLEEDLKNGAAETGRSIWTWKERLDAELDEIEALLSKS